MDMFKILQISLYGVLINLAGIAIHHSIAHAQSNKTLSNGEDVAMAFYKTGDILPNFDSWVIQNSPYKDTPAARRPDMKDHEMQRMAVKYQNLDIAKDTIRLRTKAEIDIEKRPDIDITGKKVTRYFKNIKFVNGPDAFYFPYLYASQSYAVMPYGLEEILTEELTEAQYVSLIENYSRNQKFSLILDLISHEAMTERPIKLDANDQWILKVKIASAELWTEQNALAWQYTAPWYISPELEKIKDIYDLKPEQSNSVGDIKPFVRNTP